MPLKTFGIHINDPSPDAVIARVPVFVYFALVFTLLVHFEVLSPFLGALFVTYSMSGTVCRLYGLTYNANGVRGASVGRLTCIAFMGLFWVVIAP